MSDDFIFRIVTEAQEAEDEFIFTTIQPFCEEVTKRKISKAELVKLLSQPEIVRCGECKHSYDAIGGTFCSYGTCVDCVVDVDFFCKYGERRADDETD